MVWAEVFGAIWRRNAGRKRGPGTRGVTAMSDERDRGVEELGPRYPSCRQDRIREKRPFSLLLLAFVSGPSSFSPLIPSIPGPSSGSGFLLYSHQVTHGAWTLLLPQSPPPPFRHMSALYDGFHAIQISNSMLFSARSETTDLLMTLAYFLQLRDSFTAA